MKADSLYGNLHHGHNVHFLATSYSFRGDYDEAIDSAKELLAMKENPREVKALENTRTAVAQGWFCADGRDGAVPEVGRHPFRRASKPEKPRLLAWYHWARADRACGEGQCG